MSSNHQRTYVVLGLAAIATAVALWYASSKRDDAAAAKKAAKADRPATDADAGSEDSGITPTKSNVQATGSSGASAASGGTAASSTAARSASSGAGNDDDKALHRRIEEIDRAGKALFKEKKFAEAAEAFTEALELIEKREGAGKGGPAGGSQSLTRQVVTLTNNRSAMYEKAALPDLALADCDAVLAADPSHAKARARRLRILEGQGRHVEALVEVCALQLKYMNDNRDKLRLGLPPTGQPPVSQSKIEDLVTRIQPGEVARAKEALKDGQAKALPSTYTVLQLLRSFSGYNKWMGKAARGGTTNKLTGQLEEALDHVPRDKVTAHADAVAARTTLLLRRGLRHAFEKDFPAAVGDFEAAFALAEDAAGAAAAAADHEEVRGAIVAAMDGDDYARLLEWAGMSRHLRYELEGALACYERCSALEPDNTELLVKRAGVKMDGMRHDEAEALFARALALDPAAADALLHRANLRMLQQRVPESQADLEECLRLHPNHLLARLRLATVFMAKEDTDGAKRMLDQAEEHDPDSSEVFCYRGELHFSRGELEEARRAFDRAAECDEDNPTPYVNAALVVANTPPANGARMPDFAAAIKLLERAIEVDPMFHAAYVQLGQMKLSMATDLSKAREVVELYDKGLEYCRTPEELKDICSMRILTVAQIDAAHALGMETLNFQ